MKLGNAVRLALRFIFPIGLLGKVQSLIKPVLRQAQYHQLTRIEAGRRVIVVRQLPRIGVSLQKRINFDCLKDAIEEEHTTKETGAMDHHQHCQNSPIGKFSLRATILSLIDNMNV